MLNAMVLVHLQIGFLTLPKYLLSYLFQILLQFISDKLINKIMNKMKKRYDGKKNVRCVSWYRNYLF